MRNLKSLRMMALALCMVIAGCHLPPDSSAVTEYPPQEFIVPSNWNSDTSLASFARQQSTLYAFDPALTDTNFSHVSAKLEPGTTYKVSFFAITQDVSAQECLAILKRCHACLVGAQGLALLMQMPSIKIPTGWIASFDEESHLWKDSCGRARVPLMHHALHGNNEFDLGYFEDKWGTDNMLVVITKK